MDAGFSKKNLYLAPHLASNVYPIICIRWLVGWPFRSYRTFRAI